MTLDVLTLLFRWVHVLAAIAAVGGTIFIRVILLPSLSVLSEDSRRELQLAVRTRWSKAVMIGIGLLLVSGLFNIGFTAMMFELPGYYIPLFLVKLVLALTIFFIASALVGRSPAFDNIRRNARFWLALNITLAVVLVCLSGVLRMARKVEKTRSAGSATSSGAVSLPSGLNIEPVLCTVMRD